MNKMKTKMAMLCLTALMALTARGGEVWYGLWNSDLGLERRAVLYGGENRLYVRLTAQNSPLLVGGRLSAMRFYLSDKTPVAKATVWVATSLTATPLLTKELPLDALRDLDHDGEPVVVSFDEALSVLPATNPYASVYVGYTLTLDDTDTETHMVAGGGRGETYSNFYDNTDVSAGYGALALQVMASGPNIVDTSVSLAPMTEQTALTGSNGETTVTLLSQGSRPFGRVSYVVSIDGEQQAELSYELPDTVREIGRQYSLPVTFSVGTVAAERTLSVTLTHTDDQPVATPVTSQTSLVALARPALKRAVMEEFTGAWCNNCVRGFVGMGLLGQQYGERFIPIAVHGQDPMQIRQYYYTYFFRDKITALGGYPSCTVDRWVDGDPYCGYTLGDWYKADELVDDALARMAVADIGVTAHWTDDTRTAISGEVQTEFLYSSDDAHYALVLVLTADSLTGSGQAWQQVNGYDKYHGAEEPLQQFVGKGYYLPDMAFNHVAIDAVGVEGGISGSISAPLTVGETQQYAYTLPIADNALVQHKHLLDIVALLLDTRDGSVVNAATVHVGPDPATAVSRPAAASSAPAPVYDLTGRRVAHPARHGLYIAGGKKILR